MTGTAGITALLCLHATTTAFTERAGLPAKYRLRVLLGASILAFSPVTAPASGAGRQTATPIEHLIVIIGENRGFDHIFGVYKPNGGQSIANLLSRTCQCGTKRSHSGRLFIPHAHSVSGSAIL